MCVCFGVDWFPHHFFAPEKVQAAFAHYRRLAVGGCALSGNLCVYRMQRTIFESSLHFKSVWKSAGCFFQKKIWQNRP